MHKLYATLAESEAEADAANHTQTLPRPYLNAAETLRKELGHLPRELPHAVQDWTRHRGRRACNMY